MTPLLNAGAIADPPHPTPITRGDLEGNRVFDRAAIGVGAPVGAVTGELVEQITVGAVQFDAVETGGFGVRCSDGIRRAAISPGERGVTRGGGTFAHGDGDGRSPP